MHKLRVSIDQGDEDHCEIFIHPWPLCWGHCWCSAWEKLLGAWTMMVWFFLILKVEGKASQDDATECVRLVAVARGKSAIFEPPLVRIGGASPWNPLGVTFLGGWLGWMLETPGGWNERHPKDSNTKLWNMSIQWLIPGLNHWLTILIYFESCSTEYL